MGNPVFNENQQMEEGPSLEAQKERAEVQRLTRPSLMFGIEPITEYTMHNSNIRDAVENKLNDVIVTWSQKEAHWWSSDMKDYGHQKYFAKINELA